MRNFKKDDLVFYLYLVYTEMMPQEEITEKKREELVRQLYSSSKTQLVDLWNQVMDCGKKWEFNNGDWTVVK
jgi:hypothetical protein